MNIIIASLKCGSSLLCVLLTCHTVLQLMVFLSYSNISAQNDKGNSTIISLVINTFLISLFVLQHSILAQPVVKSIYKSYKLEDVERTIFNIATCLVLQLLMNNWKVVNYFTLWSFNASAYPIVLLFASIHILCWVTIYAGCICMDINDLLGYKQIYYSIKNSPNPNSMKSQELVKLYNHMRHPSFLGFLIILWFTPIMSLDRLLLAVMISLYMVIAWRNEESDYEYQKYQYQRKYHELDRMK